MTRLTPSEKKQIHQRGAELARKFCDPSSESFQNPTAVPSIRSLQQEFERLGFKFNRTVIGKYLKEGVRLEMGSKAGIALCHEMWPPRYNSEISPDIKQSLQQQGATLTENYCNPISKSYHNLEEIPSIMKIQKEFLEKNIKITRGTITRHLRKGVQSVVGPDKMNQIFHKMWPRLDLPPEEIEKIRDRGADLARLYCNPEVEEYHNPDMIPPLVHLQKEFATQGISASRPTIGKYIREGVERVVEKEDAPRICDEMWPHHLNVKLPPEDQEMIRVRGADLARQYRNPKSEMFHNPDAIPAITRLQAEFAAKGITASSWTIGKYLKEGARRAVTPEEAPNICNEMWPPREHSELTSEDMEKIRQRGEKLATEFSKQKLENSQQYSPKIPSVKKLKREFAAQGIYAEKATVAKYLKQGVKRVVGWKEVTQISREMWPQLLLSPENQEKIRVRGAELTHQYCNPESKEYQNPDAIPTQMNLYREFKDKGMIISHECIRKYLLQGVEQEVGSENAKDIYCEMWPRAIVSPEKQDLIRQRSAEIVQQYLNPESLQYLDASEIPSMREIRQDLGIKVSDGSMAKFLLQGVKSIVGPDQSIQIYSEMWPVHELPLELQEKIGRAFVEDAKHIEEGNTHLVKSTNYWKKEFGVYQSSIYKFGKIGLQKEYGQVKGLELYEKRMNLYTQEFRLGFFTHVVWENAMKNAVKTQGINWYNEVKLAVPDPKFARSYVKADSIAVFEPHQVERILQKIGRNGKTLQAELQLTPEIIRNAREILFDPTADITPNNLLAKATRLQYSIWVLRVANGEKC